LSADALKHNLSAVASSRLARCGVFAVVKAKHGRRFTVGVETALASNPPAPHARCADIEEASSSGRAASAPPILVFGAPQRSDLDGLFDYALNADVSNAGGRDAVCRPLRPRGVVLDCHLKIDTA
jgi:alanine racemase